MAKINLTTQHYQENLSAVASLGVLICMVVTIMGIKLWWFKHRLSFEQSSTQNGAIGGGAPAVIVPRRSKQQKYKKHKRYSQQIYESVEVHGVFRQKHEDDVEIKRPQQLPPVRTSQLSEISSCLLLPPPRYKKRDQVHSTAFEELEIVTSPAITASSSDLTSSEINTKITLTFEEFERQFKLKEIRPKASEPQNLNNEVLEVPLPPLRLNRSSSAMTKPEKPQNFLKSSQSITIPEFRKVIEKRSRGFSSPKEDLTKIDDSDEAKIFETFGERRPTGYIKYEEVDNELQKHYEKELNAEIDKDYYQSINSSVCESNRIVPALKALRNERIIYNNDSNESPDIQITDEYNFNKKSYKWENVDYKAALINHKVEIKDQSAAKVEELHSKNFAENIDTEFELIQEVTPTESAGKEFHVDFQSVKERKPTEFLQDVHNNERELTTESSTTELVKVPEIFVTGCQVPNEFAENSKALEKEIVTELNSINVHIKSPQVKEQKSNELVTITKENTENFDSLNFEEDFDNQFSSWPQFEEKVKTPTVNVRRFNNQILDTQCSFEENYGICVTNINDSSSVSFTGNKTANQTETDQRRPTGFVRDWSELSEFKDMDQWQENFNNKFYNQIRSFMTTEHCEATFDPSLAQQSDSEEHHNSAIKERKPTGFVSQDEYFVTFGDESDEDSKPDNVHSNVKIVEIQTHTVKFADNNCNTCPGNEIEKFTLNQRRPTGYIKQLEMFDLTSEEKSLVEQTQSINQDLSIENKEILKNYLETQEVSHNSTIVKFKEMDESSKDYENNTKSFIKQRRPTGYVRKEELDKLGNNVNDDNDTGSKNNEDLNQGSPTGFIRKEDISKHVNFQLNSHEDGETQFGNKQLQQRRPTGFVKKNELKCLDHPAPIFHPSNDDNSTKDFDNHLWQEMEKDVEQDVSNNFEEQFAKIRQSYELNEADFLELKDDLQKSPKDRLQQPLGFGKSIEDDWESFENLKTQTIMKPLQSPQEIHTTLSDAELNTTTSILKEHKIEEDIQPKPRKSKVTFDFKTVERVIPVRKSRNYSEEDSDYDDDLYDKPPPPITPKPMQRVSNINYNTVVKPMEISLLGYQMSQEDNGVEDSWSAIRKHRNLTEEFQNISVNSKLSPPQLAFNTHPPKPSYRNPMAQLAIQHAKEVRSDMDGFKSRSINDRKPDTPSRQRQKFFNLSSNDYETTEA